MPKTLEEWMEEAARRLAEPVTRRPPSESIWRNIIREAQAEERARCAGLVQAAWESLRGDEPALLALQVYAATIEERTDEPEPGWGDRAVDEARAAGTEPGPAGEEG